MFGNRKKSSISFESLCEEYYEKILRYLYAALGNEASARDYTQEVFLVACEKMELLSTHPNPGGFLFQTTKTLVKKARRQSFARLAKEQPTDEETEGILDLNSEITTFLDKEINEDAYIDTVLSYLSEDKLKLYSLYYINQKGMGEIAAILGIEETALRMRYVRLRREIKGIISKIAEEQFIF